MKLFVVLLPLVLAGPYVPVRRYIPEENDPDFKRYIYVENAEGNYEVLDLKVGNKTTYKITTSDVEYDLYTSRNPDSPYVIVNNDVTEIPVTFFNPARLSIFVIHGWNNNRNSAVNTQIREAVISADLDVNLFIVDWKRPANLLYLSAKNSVVAVGEIVGKFITQIQQQYNLDGSRFVLIGHSLGAHVAGSAGATVGQQIGNIIGLDPAGPLFSLNRPDERLDITDARVVQVIHTNGNLLGIGSSIGHFDYFPNGGMSQPGCFLDLAGTCSHSKAYQYMAEAIKRGPVFQGVLCGDYKKYKKGQCSNNQESIMGELVSNTVYFGDYYLKTNSKQPFAISQ